MKLNRQPIISCQIEDCAEIVLFFFKVLQKVHRLQFFCPTSLSQLNLALIILE